MTRLTWVSFLALALIILIGPGAVLAAESKKLEAYNCEWTLAPGWSFSEVPEAEVANGWIARATAGSTNAFVMASLYCVTTDDPNFLSELSREMRDHFRGQLSSTTSAKVGNGSLAGLSGTVIHIVGKDREERPTMMRIYGIQKGKRIHQLMLHFVNGSQEDLAATADKTRRGFKLLSGGGDEGADEVLLGMDSGGDSGGDPADGANPTQTFPGQNLKWTIPSGSPFGWRAVNTDEDMTEGLIAALEAEVEHPPKKGKEDDGPTTNTATVRLFFRPLPEGFEPHLIVKNPGNQTNWEKANFDRLEYARTKVVEKLPLGNYEGSGIQMVGMKDERVRFLRLYFASLKGKWYRWEILFQGDRKADDDFKAPLRKLMEGLEFLETTEAVRGPLALHMHGISTHGQKRGSQADREKEVSSLGFKALKPEGLAVIKLTPGQVTPNLRAVWEMRSEDGQAYFYFDIQSWTVASVRQERDPEITWIKTREGQWKEHVESPQTVKKGKDAWFKTTFNSGKGFGYEFTGYQGETPFIERGYVVKYKKHLFWVRFQFGGEDAEKVFKKIYKTVQKKLKFNR